MRVCACMHTCMHVLMHVCIPAFMYVYTCTSVWCEREGGGFLEGELGGAPQNNKQTEFVTTGSKTLTEKPPSVCKRVRICACVCMCMCMYVSMPVCMCVHLHVCGVAGREGGREGWDKPFKTKSKQNL